MKWNRSGINYFVDALLFGLLGALSFIGILLGFVIPEGPSQASRDKFFWLLHRHQWGDLHLVLSLVFLVALIVHLVLHWGWIKACGQRLMGRTWSMPALLAAPVLVLLVSWALVPTNPAEYARYGARVGERDGRHALVDHPDPQAHGPDGARVAARETAGHRRQAATIDGRSSLAEVARQTGVPAERIAAKLGLPSNVPLHERLGRLRRQYGFSMTQLREIIGRLQNGRR